MFAAMRDAPPIYQPSKFWEEVTALHLYLLERDGPERFKQTLNNSYFQMDLAAYRRALPRLLADWLMHPDLSVLRAKAAMPSGGRVPWMMRSVMALYYEYVQRRDWTGVLDKVDEPELGAPTTFQLNGKTFTQDLLNSTLEFGTISHWLPSEQPPRTVAELGAGYGRLAYVFAQMMPAARYVIVDIPPTLYMSQWYLTRVLPDVATFRFRPFTSYAEVAPEIEAARLVFVEPQQLALFPRESVDLFITISSLAEMRPEQVAHYLAEIDRVCDGHFYMKQWQVAHNPFDDVLLRESDYVVPAHWALVKRRSSLVPGRFFERMYRCR